MVRISNDALAALRDERLLSDRKLNALRALLRSMMRHRSWVLKDNLEEFVTTGDAQRIVLNVLTIVALKMLSNYVITLPTRRLTRGLPRTRKPQATTVG